MFRSRRTKQKKFNNLNSALYYEAFYNAMKTKLGLMFFKNDQPVLITGIIEDKNKRNLKVQYFLNSKTETVTINSAEEFYNVFLTQSEQFKKAILLKTMNFNNNEQ